MGEQSPVINVRGADALAGRIVICHAVCLVSDLLAYMIRAELPGTHVIQVETARDIGAAFAPGQPVDLILWGAERIGDDLLRDIDNLCRAHHGLRIGLLTADSAEGVGRIPARLGLSVILPESMTGTLLLGAVRKALAHSWRRWPELDSRFAAMPIEISPPYESLRSRRMSARQAEVLSLLAQGQSNKRIGIEMGLSENTVKSHVKALMRKLGARNRTEAALIGLGAVSRSSAPKRATPI